MTNEEPIISDAQLTKEWERICELSPEELKAELRELGIYESDLQACRRKFIEKLEEEIRFPAPRSGYKM